MEASDQQQSQTDGGDGSQDPQPGEVGQPQPGSSDEVAGSQEQAPQDSQLTTLQPDQPAPTEPQRAETAPDAAQAAEPVQNQAATLFPSSADQNDAAVQREQELEAARRAHNERTGGGEIKPGEVQAQRQEHNDRTGGGLVPSADNNVVDDGPDSGLGQE